ncbi:MAG TPA: hypothetical protein VGJ20_15275 [Xanthobacteraceae bacterium]|jgi:hypothetical protein
MRKSLIFIVPAVALAFALPAHAGVDGRVVANVKCSTSANGVPLLGQSFLQRFKSCRIDNNANALVLE